MPRVAMVVKPDITSESVVDVKPRQEYTIGHREVLFKINLQFDNGPNKLEIVPNKLDNGANKLSSQ